MVKRKDGKTVDHFDKYGLLIEVGSKVVYSARSGGSIKRGYVTAIDDKGFQCEWEKPKRLDICRHCTLAADAHRDTATYKQLLDHWFEPVYSGVEPAGKGRPTSGQNVVVVKDWENP